MTETKPSSASPGATRRKSVTKQQMKRQGKKSTSNLQFEIIEGLQAGAEFSRTGSMPNLSEQAEVARHRFTKLPLEEKLKLFDLQRRKMAGQFGLTTSKMKQLLANMKKKFIVIP